MVKKIYIHGGKNALTSFQIVATRPKGYNYRSCPDHAREPSGDVRGLDAVSVPVCNADTGEDGVFVAPVFGITRGTRPPLPAFPRVGGASEKTRAVLPYFAASFIPLGIVDDPKNQTVLL